jgi:tripartite-type tricarboxylate transporter receptor subunit TctC
LAATRFTLRCFFLLFVAAAHVAYAADQAYPSRVIRYVVSDSPGSGLDTLARIVAEGLSGIFGYQVVVDNRPGAGGNIGAEVAARGAPDGYTLGQIATTHAVNATLYKSLGYDLVRDFTPVTQLASIPSIAVVPASSQAMTIADLLRRRAFQNAGGRRPPSRRL